MPRIVGGGGDNIDKAEKWVSDVHSDGGVIFSADFTKHYEDNFIVNGLSEQLRIALNRLRSCDEKTIHEYQQLDTNCERTLRFGPKYGMLERATHMIYILQIPNILYRPIVRYNHKHKHLRLVNGSARVLNLYHRKNKIPVMYNHYGDSPFIPLENMKVLNTAQEIFSECLINGGEYNEEFVITRAPIIDIEPEQRFEYLNFCCAGKLNLECQIEWQKNSVDYWNLLRQFSDEIEATIALTSGSIEKDFKEW